ncbi:MAG: DinB family protein [Bacteroidota bacterium]
MSFSKQLAQQFTDVYLSGNWVATNLKTQLSDLSWEQATTKIENLNTIAALAYHINYYIAGVANALETGNLEIRDKYSFDYPVIENQDTWAQLQEQIWKDGQRFIDQIEQLSDADLQDDFVDAKYGPTFRNIVAMIEHTNYHLGQIVLLKKLVLAQSEASD